MILGPTGVGKTELTLRLAEIFNVPVINADSRQIFSEIPIGTAAPTSEQLARVKHFFVGNHHLSDYYSASLYEADALEVISEQHTRGNLALMSGGSMMYIDAVCNGIDDIPTVDDATRTLMKQRLASEGLPKLVEELHQLDPEHWAIVDHNNPTRNSSPTSTATTTLPKQCDAYRATAAAMPESSRHGSSAMPP